VKRLSILLLATVLLLPAAEGARAGEATFAAIAERAITGFIQPGHEFLATAADDSSDAMAALCEAPSTAALTTARDSFGDLVPAWSAIELIRFGPAREDNRYERIFYWPDRKGIGLRQIRAALAAREEGLLDGAVLWRRSVALQGLAALEFVLFGGGAETLAGDGADGGYRCRFGATVARGIAVNARYLAAAWRDADGFARLMREPGDDNPVFRTHAEVLKELLGAMTQQFQFVRDAKLLDVIGTAPSDAKPKRAPFWRADATLDALGENVRSVLRLYEVSRFSVALDDRDVWIRDNLAFELGQVEKAWSAAERPFVDAAARPETHELLTYSRIPLGGAQKLLAEEYAAATGLTVGFNALDGD
jgi:hypothetical protein